MKEIPIIGEVKITEKRADGSDWIEIELSAEGMALLKTDQRIVYVMNFERRQTAMLGVAVANQGV